MRGVVSGAHAPCLLHVSYGSRSSRFGPVAESVLGCHFPVGEPDGPWSWTGPGRRWRTCSLASGWHSWQGQHRQGVSDWARGRRPNLQTPLSGAQAGLRSRGLGTLHRCPLRAPPMSSACSTDVLGALHRCPPTAAPCPALPFVSSGSRHCGGARGRLEELLSPASLPRVWEAGGLVNLRLLARDARSRDGPWAARSRVLNRWVSASHGSCGCGLSSLELPARSAVGPPQVAVTNPVQRECLATCSAQLSSTFVPACLKHTPASGEQSPRWSMTSPAPEILWLSVPGPRGVGSPGSRDMK